MRRYALVCSSTFTSALAEMLRINRPRPRPRPRHLPRPRPRPRPRPIAALASVDHFSTVNASTLLAGYSRKSPPPPIRHNWCSSSTVRLSGRINDLGHSVSTTGPRAQTGRSPPRSSAGRNPHRRCLSRPFDRQSSHFHAAWFANWNWKATISFFVRPRRGTVRS